MLRLWRPSPLFRARRLEKALDTPAKIFYKYEGVSPAGSHKPNTAVPQAFYNHAEGVTKLTTETGAGQVGQRVGLRLRPVRDGVRGVAGGGVVPPEALPQDDDGDLGGHRASQPVAGHRVRPQPAGGGSRPSRLLGHRHLRGDLGGGCRPRDPLLAGQRAQPRDPAPDDHRRGGPAPDGHGGGDPRPSGGLHRRRFQLRRPGPAVPSARSWPATWRR